MSVRKLDEFGSKILTIEQLTKLRNLLKQKGINLILENDTVAIKKLFKTVEIPEVGIIDNADDLFQFMRENDLVGGFDAVNKQFLLPEGASELVAFHEMTHVKHFEHAGEAYHDIDLLDKEMYVWEQIYENRQRWTKAKLETSLEYINDIRTSSIYNYNLEPIKIP